VGYCPEVDAFYEEMSGRQFLQAMARLCGFAKAAAADRVEQALEFVGMKDRADRRLRGYSKGMRQRIKVAQALLHDPQVLVLDEPLSGVDPVGRQEFLAFFRQLAAAGMCLLVSSHELEELEKLTDQVAIMARGRIAAVGTVPQIRDRLNDHPLSVLIQLGDTASADSLRQVAGLLLGLPEVVGVEMGAEETLIARARNPRQFFAEFTRLVLEEDLDVRRLETLDDSTHAILSYLLGGSRESA
jgi:ABC-2 type transport system ATP-binding protein